MQYCLAITLLAFETVYTDSLDEAEVLWRADRCELSHRELLKDVGLI